MKQRISVQTKSINNDTVYELPEHNLSNIQVDFLPNNNLTIPDNVILNKLEAVTLLITSNEIISNRFEKFIMNILTTTTLSNDIYFLIFTNNNDYKLNLQIYLRFKQYITKLKKLFKNVCVVNTDIPKSQDVYILQRTNTVPKYGNVSGPNLLFLYAMNYCKRFNTVLLLESDCILSNGWLDKCKSYVTHSGTFLISGSTYDGDVHIKINPKDISSFFHINGVAFYKTGSKELQKVIKELDSYLVYYAKNIFPINAYDYVLSNMIFHKLTIDDEFMFWKYIYRNITKNTLILNYSLQVDKNKSPEEIYKKFPSCVVLHKKLP